MMNAPVRPMPAEQCTTIGPTVYPGVFAAHGIGFVGVVVAFEKPVEEAVLEPNTDAKVDVVLSVPLTPPVMPLCNEMTAGVLL